MQDTLTLLAQHHNDGHKFMQLMKESAANRFNEDFWAVWAEWIEPVLSDPPQIADYGCGPGSLLDLLRERYPQARLIGVEYAPWMLEELDSHRYEVIQHDLHEASMPIADSSLDAITSIYGLHEMVHPIRLLQSIHRCLKPGGRSLIVDWVRAPLDNYMVSQAGEDIFDESTSDDTLSEIFTDFMEHNRYSRDDVAWMLERVGFTLLENVLLPNRQFGRWVVEKR